MSSHEVAKLTEFVGKLLIIVIAVLLLHRGADRRGWNIAKWVLPVVALLSWQLATLFYWVMVLVAKRKAKRTA